MKISIIIPTYKPGEYFWDCLNSIYNQSLDRNNYETIIVLNGCDEPYQSEIISFIDRYMVGSNIRVYQIDKGGVSNARNYGINKSSGEYITFIDDDDIISSSYLEELISVSSPTCIGCANSYAFKIDTKDVQNNFISLAFQKCKDSLFSLYKFRSYLSPPWCKLIHKDIIGKVKFSENLSKGEDGLFCFAISPHIKEMKLTSNSAIYYQRIRAGSAMRRKNSILNELVNTLSQEKEFISLFLRHPLSYNFTFFITRIIAIFRNFLIYIR